MNGADEVNMGTNGVVLKMKENPRSRLQETEDEHVSNVHSTNMTHKDLHNYDDDHDDDDHDDDKDNDDNNELPMRTVHANDKIKVPSGRQADQIKEFADIACKTGLTSKIMNFSPIDHDSAIS